MQREITEKSNIFEENGKVECAGWSRENVFIYNGEQSKNKGKHSTLCCFSVNSEDASLYIAYEKSKGQTAVKIAVADLKRGGTISDCFAEKSLVRSVFGDKEDITGDFEYEDKRVKFSVKNEKDGKHLRCECPDFGENALPFELDIILKENNNEGVYALAPFERNRKYFYYKAFKPSFCAVGKLKLGRIEYSFEELSSLAYYDLTRFYKPREHDYQRLSCDCVINEKRFSLCLASRVGDNRYGNENCFFIDGRAQKLSQINVNGTVGRTDRPWYFKGGISAVDITFRPFTVRGEPMSAVMSNTTVVFGRLYGEIKRADFSEPLVLDNAPAHMIFSKF